jgi:hypothetical protein
MWVGAAPVLISRRTWYSSETAHCRGFNRLTARMRAVCPDLITAGQPSCFPATLGMSAVRTREKSQRVRSTPGRTVLSGMLGCLRIPYQPHRRCEHARGRRTPVETRLAIAGATLIAYRTLSKVEGKSSLFGWCGIGDGRRGTSCTQTVFSMSRQS